ncbi:MAG: hypothetical protein GXY83_13185 [Rhodopirellula sp.]|nr:hypothetical protein [Rhodopirellula sp.]
MFTRSAFAAGFLPLAAGGLDCRLDVVDGDRAVACDLTWTTRNGVYQGCGDGLQVTVGPVAAGRLAQVPVGVANRSETQRRIEIRLGHQGQSQVAVAGWWDGWLRVTHPIAGRQRVPFQNAAAQTHLPLAALRLGERAAVLGRAPEPLNSYFIPELVYHPDGLSEFTYSLRMVLASGQSDSVRFVAGLAEGARYDLRAAAWQAYMDAFPSYFRPTPGISFAALGASIQYQSWQGVPDLELFRRLRTTWDWCYAPFRRAGDMWGRDEDWDYKPLKSTFGGKTHWLGGEDLSRLSPEAFRTKRAAYFAEWGYDCGHLFYNPSGAWVEKQLAQRRFADAIAVNPAYQTERGPWVTHWDSEVLVQPHGTSYWPRLQEDLQHAARELDICGFAFDVFAGVNNYGPAAQLPLPGRAWDERGIYVDIGIGMIEQAKLIHSLKLEGKPFERLAVVGGGGQCAMFSDAGLLELTLFKSTEKYPLARMALGGKPAVMWKGWNLRFLLPELETMSRREFVESFARIADYVRLKAFQWGIYPTYPYIVGVEPLQRDMPLLVELMSDGWQPLAPVDVKTDGSAELWIGRYGCGNRAAIVLCNPQERALDATVASAAEPGFVGSRAYVAWRDPAVPLVQQLSASTALKIRLPGREATILRPVLAVQSSRALNCHAALHRNLESADARIALTADSACEVILSPSGLPGYALSTATLNAAPLSPSGKARLKEGENTLSLHYVSRDFRMTAAELARFQFLDADGKIAFRLVSPQTDSRVARRMARRLHGFFDAFTKATKSCEAGPLEVVAEVSSPPTPCVVLRITSDAEPGWSLDSSMRSLVLTAADEQQAIGLTLSLLAALEPRFPWVVPFKSYAGIPARFQLNNKTLYQAMREEGLPCGR